jgi:hypothetical protein
MSNMGQHGEAEPLELQERRILGLEHPDTIKIHRGTIGDGIFGEGALCWWKQC